MLNTFTEFVSKTNLNLYNKIWYKEIIFSVSFRANKLWCVFDFLPIREYFSISINIIYASAHYLAKGYSGHPRTRGGQLSTGWDNAIWPDPDFLTLLTQKLWPSIAGFASFRLKLRPPKNHWKQIWAGCVLCTLGSGCSGAGDNFPLAGPRGEPADTQCTVQYCAVHCSTALYWQFVLSPRHTLPCSLSRQPRTGSDVWEEGELRYEASSGPESLPSLFLWSKLPQLTLTASLSSETDGRAIEVICKTLRIRLWCHTLEVVHLFA